MLKFELPEKYSGELSVLPQVANSIVYYNVVLEQKRQKYEVFDSITALKVYFELVSIFCTEIYTLVRYSLKWKLN